MSAQPAFDQALRDLKRDPTRPVRVQVDALEVELRVVRRGCEGLGSRIAALGPWEGETETELTERLRRARVAGGSAAAPEL